MVLVIYLHKSVLQERIKLEVCFHRDVGGV
jgi:hypothetical protein